MLKKHLLISFTLLFLSMVCVGQQQMDSNVLHADVIQLPILTLDQDTIFLDTITKGQQVPISFSFTNTGNADLIIEIVTTCNCTSIEWPTQPIAPGEKGIINAVYDSSTQDPGMVNKSLDIVANTEPLLIEARFMAYLKE